MGENVSLSDFLGRKLILYFYPEDDTPSCTAEACNLNENYNYWLNQGYAVVGVSPDTVASHKKFAAKYGLNFTLLADTERKIIEDYGVWGEKNLFGRTYMGVLRTTFVIDEKSVILEVIEKVESKDHTNQIIKTLNI